MRQKMYLVIILILCFSIKAQAESSLELTLPEALRIAYAQNPKMVQARQGVKAAQGEKITAASWDNPQVEIEPDLIKVKQPLDPFGKNLKGKIARSKIKSQEQGVKSVWGDIYSQVRDAYSKIILDQKEVELQKANLKAMRQFFSHVQLRYQGGKVLKNQMQRSKVELLRVQGEYLKAENSLKLDKARLNLLLGRSKEASFEIKGQLDAGQLTLDLEHLTRLAMDQSPSIKQEKFELDMKTQNVHKEQLNRLPSMSLGFQKSDEEEKDDLAAVFEISVPLWNLNQGEIKKAQAEQLAQETRMQEVFREVDFEVYRLYLEADLEQKQLSLYKKSLDEANEMFVMASMRYQEGDISFIEYLDQVNASMASRIQYYRGLFVFQKSVNALERTVYVSLRGEEFFNEIR